MGLLSGMLGQRMSSPNLLMPAIAQGAQGMPSPDAQLQQANMQETRIKSPDDARVLVQQLQANGYQAYVLPDKSGGDHVIRFWPLNPNQGR